MKISSLNFVNIPSHADRTIDNNDIHTSELCHDPLNGAGNEQKTFYRLDSVVFAEPVNSNTNEAVSATSSPEVQTSVIDNVVVKKKVGRKNKKYYFDIEDVLNPICPQPNCARAFTTVTLLKAHIRKVHCADRNRYICERCGAGFPAEYLMRRHTAVHEMRQVECPVCHKMLSERTNLTVHLRCHSAQRPHGCHTCDRSFVRKAALDVHVKFVHSRGELKCGKCDTKFTSRVQWSRHEALHKSKAP